MMHICMYCNYTTPAKDSMGVQRFIESLTKALIQEGHEVTMKVNPDSVNSPAPIVNEVPSSCDIIHYFEYYVDQIKYETYNKPYIRALQGGGNITDQKWKDSIRGKEWVVAISKFIADHVQVPYYIYNSVDPDELIFSDKKDNYFLWLGGTDWGEQKGLFSSIMLAKKMKFNLKIAGAGKNTQIINSVKQHCDNKIEYIGSVNGKEKAEILSKAKGVLMIGTILDAFGMVNVESLMSGTPVIARNIGVYPEVLNEDVAFLCDTPVEMAKAIVNIHKKDPYTCRDYALKNFHPTKIAKEYILYYEKMIDYWRNK